MKFRNRLMLSYLSVVVFASLIFLVGFYYFLDLKANADRLVNYHLVEINHSHAINMLLQRAKSNTREARLQHLRRDFKAKKYAADEVRYALSRLHFQQQNWQHELALSQHTLQEEGESSLQQPIWQFIDGTFRLLTLMQQEASILEQEQDAFTAAYQVWLTQSRALQNTLQQRVEQATQAIRLSSEDFQGKLANAQQAFLIALSLLIIYTLVLSFRTSQRLAKPIAQLNDYAMALSNFNFAAKPARYPSQEFDQLSEALTFLAQEIAAKQQQMTLEIEQRKQSELTSKRLSDFNQTILNGMADAMFGLDTQGQISFINKAALTLLRVSPAQLLHKPYNQVLSFIDLDDKASKANQQIDDIIYRHCDASPRTVAKLDTPTGMVLYIEYEATELLQDGDFAGVVVVFRDYSSKFNLEQELKLTGQVFDTLSEAIMVTDKRNRCIKVNPAFTLITGLTSDEVLGKEPDCIFTSHHTPLFYKTLWHHLYSEGSWQGEIWSKRENGELFPAWVKVSVIKHQAEISHHVITFFDISEQKEVEQKVKFLSMRDPLTGVPNRGLFQKRLKNRLLSAAKSDQSVALIIIDLNRFKEINSQFGLEVGDTLLKQVVSGLTASLSAQDTLARLGGDEFALLAPHVGQVALAQKLAELKTVFSEPFQAQQESIRIGATFGVAVFPDDADNVERLLNAAQFALQQAKFQGKDFSYFHKDMNLAIEHKKKLTKALNVAIAENQLQLYYQPKVLPNTGEVTGFEALIRWQHDELGFIPPADFIPLAEETGLIDPLGEWIIFEAANQAAKWVAMGYEQIKVAINLSPKQFVSARLAQIIQDSIVRAGVKPANLELEITESMLMEDVESAINVMQQFSHQGINISLDDFGTGYSSLSYLKRFPIHTLKIDRSFVAQLSHDNDDAKIVSTIITMAHTLGLQVVAEGVETKEQMDFLKGRQCDQLQGYYFSAPVAANEADKLLKMSFFNSI
ncbi:EAL domain-containing protein [Motilimonas eburnea]|uniref:EAL domain-containing protein n=1 Tax=Motilimonas eburnea TaxID=1737488 RepID=UPI001E44451C|nr:EAL domain-containing protein [Motilimonas eburnea]MCE2571615.1 EAL domain-containing protein [Motilimonas eburnea]